MLFSARFSKIQGFVHETMDALWLEVKIEGDLDYGPIIGLSVTAALVGGWLLWRGVRDRRRKANRCRKWKTV